MFGEVVAIKTYSFRLGKDDEDIQKTLGSMSGSARGKYMKDAIRFYGNLGAEIRLLNERIAELSTALEVTQPRLRQTMPGGGDDGAFADILETSIDDLLRM